MFEEANIKPVEHVEKPKKERKKRKPMTEEQKQVLRDRLKKAREAKKLKKEGKVVPPPAPKVELKVEPKVEPKVEKPKKVKVEAVERNVHNEEMDAMRKELNLLRTRNKQHEKELVRASLEKEKLKKQGLDILASYKAKKVDKMPTIVEEKVEKPQVPVTAVAPKEVKPKRYSTYKKSIWAQFE